MPRRSVDVGAITASVISQMNARHVYEVTTALILDHIGGRHVHQSRLGRFEEHSDGTLFDGVGYEPAQIPKYFRVPTAADRRRIEAFNRRVRKLQEERQAFLDEAWDRATPLTAEAAIAAARKRASVLKGGST